MTSARRFVVPDVPVAPVVPDKSSPERDHQSSAESILIPVRSVSAYAHIVVILAKESVLTEGSKRKALVDPKINSAAALDDPSVLDSDIAGLAGQSAQHLNERHQRFAAAGALQFETAKKRPALDVEVRRGVLAALAARLEHQAAGFAEP